MKAQFYHVNCDLCGYEIGLFEPCFDRYGQTLCQCCGADYDPEELERIRGEDAIYNAQSSMMNLDDARDDHR